MAKKELIQVKEFPKGIENVTQVNWAHEDIKSFTVDQVSLLFCDFLYDLFFSFF